MTVALPQSLQPMTEAEYLAFERESDIKHEFVDGEIFAMAGASWHHTVIVANINTHLNIELENSSCISVTNDMKVYVASEKSFRYPDVVVVCGDPQFREGEPDVLTNPIVIFEVLSPSTELRDRSIKYFEYQQIQSLQDYILVAQDTYRMEIFSRTNTKGWLHTMTSNLDDALTIPSIDIMLKLNAVYQPVGYNGMIFAFTVRPLI